MATIPLALAPLSPSLNWPFISQSVNGGLLPFSSILLDIEKILSLQDDLSLHSLGVGVEYDDHEAAEVDDHLMEDTDDSHLLDLLDDGADDLDLDDDDFLTMLQTPLIFHLRSEEYEMLRL